MPTSALAPATFYPLIYEFPDLQPTFVKLWL